MSGHIAVVCPEGVGTSGRLHRRGVCLPAPSQGPAPSLLPLGRGGGVGTDHRLCSSYSTTWKPRPKEGQELALEVLLKGFLVPLVFHVWSRWQESLQDKHTLAYQVCPTCSLWVACITGQTLNFCKTLLATIPPCSSLA